MVNNTNRSNLLRIGGIALIPATVLITVLTVYGQDAIYRHALEKETSSRFQVRNLMVPVASDSGQVAGSKTELFTPTPTKTSATDIPSNNTKSTPTPTDKPPEVKEIHTKEIIEEKTVVIITPTPTPSPTPTPTSAPTPTPTPDTRPFEATLTVEGWTEAMTRAVVSANKPLKMCSWTIRFLDSNTEITNNHQLDGETSCASGAGHPESFQVEVTSMDNEVKNLSGRR